MSPTSLWHNDIQLDAKDKCVSLTVNYRTAEPVTRKAALISFTFTDSAGRKIRPIGEFATARLFGTYEYIHATKNNHSQHALHLDCPIGATALHVEVHAWAKNGEFVLTQDPAIEVSQGIRESTFIDDTGTDTPVPAEDLRLTYSVSPGEAYILSCDISGPSNKKVPVAIRYYDHDGNLQLCGTDLQIHTQYGAVAHLERQQAGLRQEINLQIPSGVTSMEVAGVGNTASGIAVRTRPTIKPLEAAQSRMSNSQIGDLIGHLPASEPVVVIYTTAGSFAQDNNLLLRSNRLAFEYAEAGCHVFYFPFSELKSDNPQQITQRLYQFSRSQLQIVMDALLNRHGENNVLLCSSFSDANMVGLLDQCHLHGWKVVYEVRDDMEEFQRVGYSKWYDANLETRFAARADTVVAVSPRLHEKLAIMTGRSDIEVVPNGAPDELVDNARFLRSEETITARHRANPKVGYIGHLTESWFDWDWLLATAKQLPHVLFEIIGHGKPAALRLPSNVVYLGSMNHQACLAYAAKWRVGVIPFKLSRLTYGVDPNKAYEYVAMGLRTVSAPMGQVQDMPGALVYSTQTEMRRSIEWAVENPLSEHDLDTFNEYLDRARWSARAQQMMTHLIGGTL